MGKTKQSANDPQIGQATPEVALRHVLFAVHGAGHATKSWDMVEDSNNLSTTVNKVAGDMLKLSGEVSFYLFPYLSI